MFVSGRYLLPLLLLLLIAVILTGLALGAVKIPTADLLGWVFGRELDSRQATVLYQIRMPRVLMCILAGGLLALSGTALQGLFRNPLADPGVIGISAGSAFSASLYIVLLQPLLNIPEIAGLSALSVCTFTGAALTAIFMYRLSQRHGATTVNILLLAGIAVNALASSGTGLLAFMADDAQLRSLTFWTLGSAGGATWNQVFILAVVLAFCWSRLMYHRKSLNALALGEKEAQSIGVPVRHITREIILISALAVGSAVAFCGMIAFVGLVIPHVLRLISGPDYRKLMILAVPGGAILLCLADTVARTLVSPLEIPIGIITSLAGAPLFLYLLINQQRRQNLC